MRGLDNDGSPKEIHAADCWFMLLTPPDKGGSHAQAIRINRVRDVLLGYNSARGNRGKATLAPLS